MIELDGSHGEGGGQILRSALALSILTGKPFRLVHVRANRQPSGLRPSHVLSVKAASAISRGRSTGGSVGSRTLVFEPGELKAGTYRFDVGTAGSTGLVLQTVYLPLALRGTADSHLTLTGGTHTATSPCFHYLATTWAAFLRRIGIEVGLEMVRPGFYPRGGGEVHATVRPCERVQGLRLLDGPEATTANGFSAVAGIPERQHDIARRQATRLTHKLKLEAITAHIAEEYWEGGPGTVAAAVFRQLPVPALFFAVGERGRPAESVADDVAEQAIAFRNARAPVDPHAADQLVLPLALSPEASAYRTSEVTRHLTTNIDVIRQFLDRDISCDAEEGHTGIVRVAATGL